MISDGGQMDVAIMSHLYREPVGEDDLKASMRPWAWSDIMATLSKLMRKALVVDINKDRSGHIYKLTREGERLIERLIAQKNARRAVVA